MSRFANGVHTYSLDLGEQGNFTCTASISDIGLTSETVALNMINLPVEIVKQPKEIRGEIKLKHTDKFEHSISLSELFSDGDGHDLTYRISASDSDKITVEIRDAVLYLTVKDQLEGNITITADDGHGSTADITVDMNVKVIEPVDSATVILIVSIAVGAVLLIAAVIFIIAKKTSVMDKCFKMVIRVPDPLGGICTVEYRQVIPLTVRQEGSGKKSIMDILNGSDIQTNASGREDAAVRNTAALNKIYVEGLPFGRGIKLFDGKKKSAWKKSSAKTAAALTHKVNNDTIRITVIGI